MRCYFGELLAWDRQQYTLDPILNTKNVECSSSSNSSHKSNVRNVIAPWQRRPTHKWAHYWGNHNIWSHGDAAQTLQLWVKNIIISKVWSLAKTRHNTNARVTRHCTTPRAWR